MLWYEAMFLGGIGGLVPDLLRLVNARYEPMPEYLKRGFFWMSMIILVGLGAGVALLLAPARIIDALAIGFSAPAIVTRLLGTAPDTRVQEVVAHRPQQQQQQQQQQQERADRFRVPAPETRAHVVTEVTSLRQWWGA